MEVNLLSVLRSLTRVKLLYDAPDTVPLIVEMLLCTPFSFIVSFSECQPAVASLTYGEFVAKTVPGVLISLPEISGSFIVSVKLTSPSVMVLSDATQGLEYNPILKYFVDCEGIVVVVVPPAKLCSDIIPGGVFAGNVEFCPPILPELLPTTPLP